MGLGSGSSATVSRGVGLWVSTGAACLGGNRAGSYGMGSRTSSLGLDAAADSLLFLGLLFSGAGLALGVSGRGLRRSPGLSPRDPKKGVAGLGGSFSTTFLGGVLECGERLLWLSGLEGFVLSL